MGAATQTDRRHLTNPERAALGLPLKGRKPGSHISEIGPRVMPRPLDPIHYAKPVSARLTEQLHEMFSRSNAALERWKLGER
jgi:hypothetical protein